MPSSAAIAARARRIASALLLGTLAAGPAHAADSVVVLDLDGYGVPWESAQVMTQGLRDGFLEDGTLDPVDAFQAGERLSGGHGEEVRRARERLGHARQRMDAGDPAGALRILSDVLQAHADAWSWIARRAELADAHYFTALALAGLGRRAEAVSHLVEALYLVPDYDATRAVALTGEIRGLVGEARRILLEGEPRELAAPRVEAISEGTGCALVATGWIVADGTLTVRLHEGGRQVAQASARAEEIPVFPGDPFYADLVDTLLATRGRIAAVPPEAVPTPPVPEPEPVEARAQRPPDLAVRSAGPIRYERRPVTERWWFWTGVTTLVVGGGVAAWLGLSEPPYEPRTADGDTYTLTVDPAALGGR